MKHKSLLLIIGLFLIISSINVFGDLTDGLTAYYAFENNTYDGTLRYNATLFNGTFNSSGKIGYTAQFNGNQQMQYNLLTNNATGSYSQSFWIKFNTNDAQYRSIYMYGSSAQSIQAYKDGATNGIQCTRGSAGGFVVNGLNDNNWHQVVCVNSNGNQSIYVDGTYRGSAANSYTFTDATDYLSAGTGLTGWIGQIDEVGHWNRTLNSSEVTQLYNNGNGLTYPFFIANFTITDTNNFNNSFISNFSALINETMYNTTNGTLITPFLTNSTTLKNITIISNNMFNKTYLNYNLSVNLQATQDQYPIIFLTNKWNNTNLTTTTIFIDSINYSTTSNFIYVPYNTSKIINTSINNYINTTNNLTILQNTLNQINISQSVINFSLFEFDNNVSLSNFTLNITGYGIACNTTNSSCIIYPNNGTYNYSLIDNTGQNFYTPINNTINVNFLNNFTYYSYVTEHFINVTAKNIITNANINNFSIQLHDLTDGTDVRDFNTTTGNILIPVIHHTYNLTTYNTGYVDQSQTIIVNTSITTNSVVNATFNLYKKNSINFNVYDVTTLQKINTTNTTIYMQGSLYTYTIITPNGSAYQEVSSDVYSITTTNPSYTSNNVQVATLTGNEHLDINIYMTNTTNLFQFFATSNIGTDNGNKIPDTTCTFYLPNNGSTITIGSFITDFSGSGTIYLDTTKTYTYICQAIGYNTFQDVVKPIVASSPYNIYMTSTGGTPYTNVLNGLIISTSMSYSYPSTTAYFYYNLNSVNGTTQYFGLSTNYNGTPFIQNQTTSPSGGLLTLQVTPLNLINRSIKITYWYKVVGYDYQTWNQTYYLPIIIGGNMTLSQGIFTGNNSITDTNTNPMNPIDLGLLALLIPICLMLVLHMFGMPKILVILAGLAGDGIIIMGDMFSQMDNSTKIMTVLGMSMTIIFMFLIADNKDSVGLN